MDDKKLLSYLNSVGKTTFVKCFNFVRDNYTKLSRHDMGPMLIKYNPALAANSTKNSLPRIASYAIDIFKAGREYDALQICADSVKLDEKTIARAKQILSIHNGAASFGKYLRETGRSESTVAHYKEAFKYIEKISGINILERNELIAVKRLANELKFDLRFQKTDADGHQMYSAALNSYLNYLQSSKNKKVKANKEASPSEKTLQITNFESYLKINGLAESTIREYVGVIKLIEKRWYISVFNSRNGNDMNDINVRLMNDATFQAKNLRSHGQYSAALAAYKRFISQYNGMMLDANFDALVSRSIKDNSMARKKRLSDATVKPEKFETTSTVYKRNPDVVAEVLIRANGKCEKCENLAPFIRKFGDRIGEPFLEVHHKKWLLEGGEDTVENAVALCPNCHRQEHFGKRIFN